MGRGIKKGKSRSYDGAQELLSLTLFLEFINFIHSRRDIHYIPETNVMYVDYASIKIFFKRYIKCF